MDAVLLESMKRLDGINGIEPPPDWYYFPIAELMSPLAVIGVEYWPGLANDCSSWKLWISPTGALSQIARVCRPFEGIECHYEFHEATIGETEVRRLLDLAEEIGFGSFDEKYSWDITDCCTKRLGVRLGGTLKIVEVYAVLLDGFERLWRAIHRFAPFVDEFHQRKQEA